MINKRFVLNNQEKFKIMEKEDNKYYTPQIEEFYVGFEYEYKEFTFKKEKSGSYEWSKFILDIDTLQITQGEYNIGNPFGGSNSKDFRVKYLDQEDIESLGFQEIGQEDFYLKGEIDNWNIEKLYNKDIFSYWRINNKNNCIIMFLEIKNKSELKVLLKQLNIS